jgi:DNA modification methylase
MAISESNLLFYGDNLTIIREHIADESIDLIYLDPPFNSDANYNVLFKSPTGEESPAQIEAFQDTWHWNDTAERAFDEVMQSGNTDASEMLRAMRGFLKENDMMAYLVMMTVRMIELHRVLKPTGSLYLHCDPTASHYLKILLDAVFGKACYRNEIIWKRTSAHSDGGRFGRNNDVILFFSKSSKWIWNQIYTKYDAEYEARFRNKDDDGRLWMDDNATAKGLSGGGYEYDYKGSKSLWRYPLDTMKRLDTENRLHFTRNGGIRLKRYLDEAKGYPAQALWGDIPPINSQAQERLGYPTQKPIALLERILAASSNEGDVVLDPFCGCGTTIHAAEKMGRKWIGIDITHLAIGLIRRRLVEAFPAVQYELLGLPKDAGAARLLAETDKYQFQFWALSKIEAVPYKGGRKGADGGVDGYIYFKPDGKVTEKAVVSVKGGANVGVGMIRDLIATIEREKAKVGVLLSLEDPTSRMRIEASAAGLYKPEGDQQQWNEGFPRIQILTIEDLFEGRKPHLPWIDSTVFKKSKREAGVGERKIDQGDLGM